VEKFMNVEEREEAVSTAVLRSELGELYPMYRSLRDLRNAKGIQARLPYELVIF
jgi:protease-4